MDYTVLNDKLRFIALLRKTEIRAKSGFQCGQFPIIDFVMQHDGCTQKDIAEALHVTPASVAISLDRMESAGYIERTRNTANARCNRITVTANGKAMYQKGKECVDYLNKKMFDGMSPSEITAFEKVLDGIVCNITGENVEVSPELFFKFKEKMESEVNG